MKTLKNLISEKVVEKDGVITASMTKKQKDEVQYSIETTDHPERLGVVKGNKLVMTPEQAKNMGLRLKQDYDPNYGFETLSKAMTKSMYKLGSEIAKFGK